MNTPDGMAGEGNISSAADFCKKKNVEWANTIKGRHNAIRNAVTASAGEATGAVGLEESYQRWRAHRDESTHELREYATAMHDLATKYWARGGDGKSIGQKRGRDDAVDDEQPESERQPADEFSTTNGRYDDRVKIVVDAVKEFYCGAVEVKSCESSGRGHFQFLKLPTILTQQLREHRRNYFEANQKQLPQEEEEKLCASLVEASAPESCLRELVSPLLDAVQKVPAAEERVVVPLHVLDVGSCYGPYRGCFDDLAVPKSSTPSPDAPVGIKVTHVDLDLCPYEGSGVLQSDWLECKFHRPTQDDVAVGALARTTPNTGDQQGSPKLSSLAYGSFHLVIFCFMLSYLPTREMRLRSCFNALRALKMGGLFCVVSTRTQGPRSGKWIEPWSKCIEGLGFKIAQKVIKSKVILLTFQKVCETSFMEESDAEPYYRLHCLPLLEKYPEGMSLHEQSI